MASFSPYLWIHVFFYVRYGLLCYYMTAQGLQLRCWLRLTASLLDQSHLYNVMNVISLSLPPCRLAFTIELCTYFLSCSSSSTTSDIFPSSTAFHFIRGPSYPRSAVYDSFRPSPSHITHAADHPLQLMTNLHYPWRLYPANPYPA